MKRIEEWWFDWVGFIPEQPVLAIVAIIGATVLYMLLAITGAGAACRT